METKRIVMYGAWNRINDPGGRAALRSRAQDYGVKVRIIERYTRDFCDFAVSGPVRNVLRFQASFRSSWIRIA